MKRKLKYVIIILRSILIFIFIWTFTVATVKNISKSVKIANFKKGAIYQEDISTDNIKYYKKASNETIKTFIELPNGDCLPGNELDIVLSTQATLINDFISATVSYFVGGHASIVCSEYLDYELEKYNMDNSNSIEATELYQGHNDVSVFDRYYWSEQSPFSEVIVLRVKMSEKERDIITSFASSYIEDPYNTSFLFDTVNKTYCSDLVSKTYNKIHKNLNKDGFVTTIYDLLESNDCYMTYYHYFDSNGIKYIYYLD